MVHCICSDANSTVTFRMTFGDLCSITKLQHKWEALNDEYATEHDVAEVQLLHRNHKLFLTAELWRNLRHAIIRKVHEGSTFALSL